MYSIKKVSEMLNIPAVTIRAWENRYRIVTPLRTEGGHRLYSDADIETLRWVKQQTEDNKMKISEAVYLLQQQKKPAVPSSLHKVTPQHRNEIIERLIQSFINLSSEQANELIDFAFSMYNFEDVFHTILTPALYRIGELWETGHITVAQEHFATQLVLQRLHQFFRILPVQPHYPKALAFCPEGEFHQMGIMLFSLFLRNKGVEVIYLGPNTPYEGLTELIESKSIYAVAASISSPKLSPALEEWIGHWKKQFPQLVFVLGGSGLHPCPHSLQSYVLDNTQEVWEAWFQANMKL
ncbi:MerR family transcriptional regulator [Paenibacillus hexagrammi]|uniref:MerR family transcriptional regulator n=1 Tax=Paenibacillus hexagrammi TaxID=2908839 RepID=A0ABY3SLA0_9BACL|nr:MerR family transcriptional regulator [Paenibacillus sp. YPD9-1]UJF33999.1 MerR family transcriptional regulator [Paenibacillus sp. YPD9-1]